MDQPFDRPLDTPPESFPTLFFLASKIILLHTLLTGIAMAWSALIGQPVLAGVFALLWVLAAGLYQEWRNSI